MAIKFSLERVETELFCSSKWWGDPDFPVDMEYPTFPVVEDGEAYDYPLTFVCQIDLTEPALKMTFSACADDYGGSGLLLDGAFLRIADGTAGLDFGGRTLELRLEPADFERGYWRRMKAQLASSGTAP